jgi:hypothetical protein
VALEDKLKKAIQQRTRERRKQLKIAAEKEAREKEKMG